MTLKGFLDEIAKLAENGQLELGDLVAPRHVPLNTIGQLLRKAAVKHASDLSAVHDEHSPPAQEVNPVDASTRLPDTSRSPSTIIAGRLGEVTPSQNPIDRERFNRAWNQPAR